MEQFTPNQFNSSANHAGLNALFQFASIVRQGAGMLTGWLLLMQLPALAEGVRISQAPQSDLNAYPTDEIQAYLESCLSTATANGLEDTVAQNYCNCTITVIQKRFTYPQFVSFAESIQTTQQLPNELLQVVQQCSPQ